MQVGNIMTINIKKKSVHLKNGGEMCDIDVAVKATKNELINQMKSVFFPDGNFAFGKCTRCNLP